MKVLTLVACVSMLVTSSALADRDGYGSSSQGKLTVLRAFTVTTTKDDERAERSMSFRPGTYELKFHRGSYHKSTLCDLLPYCTKRWEDEASFYMSFSLLKGAKPAGDWGSETLKRVSFETQSGKGSVDGVVPQIAIGQGFKVLHKSTSSEEYVGSRSGRVECTVKARCWDPAGYRCSYAAGTAAVTLEDRVTTTRTRAKILSAQNVTLATYESKNVDREEGVVTAQGGCELNLP